MYIYEASTIAYEGSSSGKVGEEIIGVDVQGGFDGDSESIDVSEL